MKTYYEVLHEVCLPKNSQLMGGFLYLHTSLGNIYSNSLEALDLSYSKGIRIFELDLKLTEDNELVAVHDWTSWKKMTKYPKNTPPSKEDFMIVFDTIKKQYRNINLKTLDWIKFNGQLYTVELQYKGNQLKLTPAENIAE